MFTCPSGLIAGGGPRDPYFSSVISLLHFNGVSGGTTFTDQIGTVWTPTSATTSSTQVKFGSTSGYFASGYIQAPNTTVFEFPGLFTAECFVYITSSITTPVSNIFQVGGSSNHAGFSFGIYNGALRLSAPFVANLIQGTLTVPLNTWTHVAVTRDGSNVIRVFVNGVVDTTTATSSNALTPVNPTGSYMSVGGGQTDAQVNSIPGYMDEFRLTKGVCRYTTNFTPPGQPFPNH